VKNFRIVFESWSRRHEHGELTEMAAFEQPSMFTAFGLPDSL
jgi:hypothetical protein